MASPDKTDGKISTSSRVLAWILLVCSLLGIAGFVMAFLKSESPSDRASAAVWALFIALGSALFWFAALKGRSPRWLTSIETMYDREAERRGIPTARAKSGRGVIFTATTVVFGLLLVALGRSLGVFDGETGWFAAAAFFIAWLVVVQILWRNLRKSAN